MRHNTRIWLVGGFAAAVMFPAPTLAGRVDGQISHQSRPAAGAEVSLRCSDESVSAATNGYGQFSKVVDGGTSCYLSVSYQGISSESVAFRMSGESVRLKIQLRRWKDSWILDLRYG